MPHSEEHGSIEVEMIYLASHADPLFREDDQLVFFAIEEAVRGTMYAPSIKPFTRNRRGRDAFEAIKGQFAGKDKWLEVKAKAEQVLHSRKWTGTSNYKLESFIAAHRSAYTQLQEVKEHVPNYHQPDLSSLMNVDTK